MKHEITALQETVWEYYHQHGRHDLPWRLPEPDGSFDLYKILVSEIMLQQTQVPRVLPKFTEFLTKFPTVQELAEASLGEVLAAWSGLGYNRRAKFLWQAAQKVVRDFGGEFPRTFEALESLPGVGKNTAGAVAAYAYNQPAIFLETNIRTVFIHHFFRDADLVPDSQLLKLVELALPEEGKEQPETLALPKPGAMINEPASLYAEPEYLSARGNIRTVGLSHNREWYWALMDYGTYLKQTVGNVGRASKTYTTQSKFEGSRRKIRGQVIRALVAGSQTFEQLAELCRDERLAEVLAALTSEGMIEQRGNTYGLS